jgi:hypothetical protein
MVRHSLAVALLALTLAACGGGSRAATTSSGTGTSQYTRQVQGYLANIASAAEKQGFRRVVGGPVFGSLDDDEKSSHEMTVVAGVDYVLFGACDNDCTDVDLIVYDQNNRLVKRDILADDKPVVMFTAARSAKYRIEVVMAVCSTEPCRYGIQLNAK